MLDQQLHPRHTVEFIRVEPEGNARTVSQRVDVTEPDRVVTLTIFFQCQFQVPFFQHALAEHPKLVAKQRWRKALAPDLGFHQLDEVYRVVPIFQSAVGLDHALQLVLAELVATDRLERGR